MTKQQRKTSDVIALAVNDPRYLRGNDGEMFLCRMLECMRIEGVIAHLECHAARQTIDEAINGSCTLYSHLWANDVKGFRQACSTYKRRKNDIRVQFWAMLCMKLKAKGE
jgi:hypothetical protein